MIKYFLTILMIIAAASGCSEKTEKTSSTENEVVVKSITEKELADIINNRKGKTLFLNVWATWCVPCVEEFPAIVQLHKNYKDEDVEIIAVSVDLPEETDSKIIPFLKKQNVEFKVLVAEEKSSDEIIEMLNPDWSGAIPASFIFDSDGSQQKFLLGAQSYESMSASIDSVIAL